MDFADLLTGLISGALTVPVVSFILNNWLPFARTNTKVIVAYAASFALGTGGYFLLIWYRQVGLPATPQALLDSLWPVWFAAFGASQAVLRAVKSAGIAR